MLDKRKFWIYLLQSGSPIVLEHHSKLQVSMNFHSDRMVVNPKSEASSSAIPQITKVSSTADILPVSPTKRKIVFQHLKGTKSSVSC